MGLNPSESCVLTGHNLQAGRPHQSCIHMPGWGGGWGGFYTRIHFYITLYCIIVAAKNTTIQSEPFFRSKQDGCSDKTKTYRFWRIFSSHHISPISAPNQLVDLLILYVLRGLLWLKLRRIQIKYRSPQYDTISDHHGKVGVGKAGRLKRLWRCRGSNPRPSVCETDALPLSYIPRIRMEHVLYVLNGRGTEIWRLVDYLFFNVCLCEGENASKSQKKKVYGDVVIKTNLKSGRAAMCVGGLKLYVCWENE
jgi:hypothetical protein